MHSGTSFLLAGSGTGSIPRGETAQTGGGISSPQPSRPSTPPASAADYDLLSIGEVLVDLISERMVASLEEARSFRAFVGGQVANVARNVSLLGGRAAVVGCVGDDGFGRFIRRELNAVGVVTEYLRLVAGVPTTLSVITRHATTPDFLIFRGADVQLSPPQVPVEAIARSRVVHVSAFALSQEPSREAVLHALQQAREHACWTSLDPNYHPRLWAPDGEVLDVLRHACTLVDLTKPSLDDCRRLFGPGLSPDACVDRFLEWGVGLVALTMGHRGALVALQSGERWHIPSHDVPVADVTGAGDAFWAGLILGLLDGLPPRQAGEFGQHVAEMKLRTFGPLDRLPNRHALYRQLWREVPPPSTPKDEGKRDDEART